MDIVALIGGLLLILVGANALTDGAASVAKRFNISSLVIGLTIVAFGTSAPELTVSIVSALKGSADMAIGNVVGSNIFNTLMIVGCTAAIVPIGMNKGTLSKEIPLCILASIVLFICGNDVLINGAAENTISNSDGMLLLCFFAIFLGYTFAIAHNGNGEEETKIKLMPVWKSGVFIAGGLAGLIYGGQFFVDGASGIARGLGVSESIIGLTLVAGGTSLPELATSVVAALKKKSRDGDRECDRFEPVQYILCIGLQCDHQSAEHERYYQCRPRGSDRFMRIALPVRAVYQKAHHNTP